MARKETVIDWSAFFFSSEHNWPDKLTAIAERRFGRSPDAGAAYNFALDEISANNWKRLRERFKGTGSVAGFLSVTFLNLLEDYATAKYGKKRPREWIKRLGPLWKRVYQLLCLKRLLPETIVDALTARAHHSADEIRYAIGQIKGRIPDCGAYKGEQATDHQVALNPTSNIPEPPKALESEELTIIHEVVVGMLAGSESDVSVDPTPICDAKCGDLTEQLAQAVSAVALTNQERLLLKLIYEEGHSITSAASALRIARKTGSRMHQRITKRLKEALTPLGIADAQSN